MPLTSWLYAASTTMMQIPRMIKLVVALAVLSSVAVALPTQLASATDTITVVDGERNVRTKMSMVLDANDLPRIVYYDLDESDLVFVACTDPVCAVSNPVVLDPGMSQAGESPTIILNSAGNPVIGYHDASNLDVKLAVCGDRRCLGHTRTS